MNKRGIIHTILLGVIAVAIILFFSPIPYYLEGDIRCIQEPCPRNGWNLGPSLYQRLLIKKDSVSETRLLVGQSSHSPTPIDDLDLSDWKTYRNDEYWFEFMYPRNYTVTFKNELAINLAEDTQHQISINLHAPQSDPNYSAQSTFLDFASTVAMQQCAGDIAATEALSTYCDKTVKVDDIRSSFGIKGYKLFLNLVTAKLNANGNYETIRQETVGPVYALDVNNYTNGEIRSIEILYNPIHTQVNDELITVLDQILSTFKFTNQVVPTQVTSENQFCGGIANIQCPEGYTCKLDGNYPDAGGVCVK